MNIKDIFVSGIILVILFFSGAGAVNFWNASKGEDTLKGEGPAATECDLVATTTVVVGNQSSTQIVAAHSLNAYVRIEQPSTATNTVFLAYGATASAANATRLSTSTNTMIPDNIEMGLDTDFPYTGAVSAITNLGSTTVGVTVCRYSM